MEGVLKKSALFELRGEESTIREVNAKQKNGHYSLREEKKFYEKEYLKNNHYFN